MEREEAIELGLKFKETKQSKRFEIFGTDSWNGLNDITGGHFSNGECFRSFIKNKQKKDGTLKTNEDKLFQEKLELQSERNRLRDEGTRNRKIIREYARELDFKDYLAELIQNHCKPFEYKRNHIQASDNDLLIQLNDIHYGMEFDNGIFGKYSPEICKERLKKYLDEIISISEKEESENAYIFLGGDLISGTFKDAIRVQNSRNLIEQIKEVSELVAQFVAELSPYFGRIEIHTVLGNHSRIFAGKEATLKNEKLDSLIPFYIGARLQNIENVFVMSNEIDDTICKMNIRGNTFLGVHGDNDSKRNVVSNMITYLGYAPTGIVMGHMHHNCMFTEQRVKVYCSGSIMGADDYCVTLRIKGQPEQLVCVCTDKGVKNIYDVSLL